MSDIRALYQELIIDHGRQPRNFYAQDDADFIKEGYNPLCGDQLTVYFKTSNGVIAEASFVGKGCAISMASASLMTESFNGKTLDEVAALFNAFHQLVTGAVVAQPEQLGKLVVLAGVAEFPTRVKCATLAWHAAHAAIERNKSTISTE